MYERNSNLSAFITKITLIKVAIEGELGGDDKDGINEREVHRPKLTLVVANTASHPGSHPLSIPTNRMRIERQTIHHGSPTDVLFMGTSCTNPRLIFQYLENFGNIEHGDEHRLANDNAFT